MLKNFINNVSHKKFSIRCDDTGNVFYFSHKDFDGLNAEPFSFKTERRNLLKGYIYSYDGANKERLIVFDHGFGGGHTAYMREIELLCRQGYRVLAYDHTGCMESEGSGTVGLCQSLADLDFCIRAIKADEELSKSDISVVGHSWGGYSCMNISAFHPEISRIVVISGFVSVGQMAAQYLPWPLKQFRRDYVDMEYAENPRYARSNGVNALMRTNAKVLLIYSKDDPTVKKRFHYDVLKKSLSDASNIKFMLVEGKGHNPNYTEDAVKYMQGFFVSLTKKLKASQLETSEQKREFVSSFDWVRMTEQDMNVWDEIFKTLE
ncbi:MAG: alpha/beta hydrolase [Clostridiales bacterium]|nr:alpha/beta hydrolase [Clostridiales bacterium]